MKDDSRICRWVAQPTVDVAERMDMKHMPSYALVYVGGTLWGLETRSFIWNDATVNALRPRLEVTNHELDDPTPDTAHVWAQEAGLLSLKVHRPASALAWAESIDFRPLALGLTVREALLNVDPASKPVAGAGTSRRVTEFASELKRSWLASVVSLQIQASNLSPAHRDAHAISAQWGSQASTVYSFLVRSKKVGFRVQFAKSHPLVVLEVAQARSASAIIIAKAIDDGCPLSKAIASEYDVSAATVRAITNVPLATVGERWASTPRSVLSMLDAMPHDKRPSSAMEWGAMNHFIADVEAATGLQAESDTTLRAFVVSKLGGRRTSLASPPRVVGRLVAQRIDEARMAVQPLFETLRSLLIEEEEEGLMDTRRSSQQRATRRLKGRNSLAMQLAERPLLAMPFANLCQLAHQWHARSSEARQALTSLSEGPQGVPRVWPLISKPLQLPSSLLSAVPLATEADIQAQGDHMVNCLRNWRAESFFRKGAPHFLVAFVTLDGQKRMSTAEIMVESIQDDKLDHSGRGIRLKVVQHTGHKNAVTSQQCNIALAALLDHLHHDPAAQRHVRLGLSVMRGHVNRRRARTVVDAAMLSRGLKMQLLIEVFGQGLLEKLGLRTKS